MVYRLLKARDHAAHGIWWGASTLISAVLPVHCPKRSPDAELPAMYRRIAKAGKTPVIAFV